MKKSTTFLFVLMTVLLVSARPASAQDDVRKVKVLAYAPTTNPCGILNVDPSCVLGHLKYALSLGLGYANNPFVVYEDGELLTSIVKHQVAADLTAAIGLFGRFEFGLHVPMVVFQTDSDSAEAVTSGEELATFAPGGLRFVPKAKLFERRKHGFNLAFIPEFTVSAGLPVSNTADEDFAFEPRLVVDQAGDRWMWALNVGYRFRKRQEIANLVVNDEVTYAIGGQLAINKRISLIASVFGAVGVEEHDSEELPLEALGGLRMNLMPGLAVHAAAGAGLTDGYGAPRFRIVTGVSWTPTPAPCTDTMATADADGDGIPDQDDPCPADPEDGRGAAANDGCPDPDSDQDGVCDPTPAIQNNLKRFADICTGSDAAPADPEDKDDFEDGDGKPEPDNDADGVCDPNDTIQKNLKAYESVCRGSDAAPLDPEDKDDFEDGDGKPEPDNDADGVCDPNDTIQKNLKAYESVCRGSDLAPADPEDKDGFADEDGRPDPDNDEDGICDDNAQIQGNLKAHEAICKGSDKCSGEKETINGVNDQDGCPDKGEVKIVVNKNSVVIMDKVYFDTNSDKIQKRSFAILDLVAQTLTANPWIQRIRVEGHTDDVGEDAKNLDLSKRRAASVKKYLTDKGIDGGRLESEGYGETQPVEAGCAAMKNLVAKSNCRANNRRVTFTILQTSK